MARRRAKIVIVEGMSDETSLSIYFGRYFAEKNIYFILLRSNILSNVYGDKAKSNIITDLHALITSYLENNRYIKLTYIDEIIQVVDTDGMFIDDINIIENKNINKVQYTIDNIITSNKIGFQNLNCNKRRNIEKLLGKRSLAFEKQEIPYSIYFMSRNLEHVLHNKTENLVDDEKSKLSYEFANRYNDIKNFITFITESDFCLIKGYKESWEFIQKDANSLKRYTNIGLIFKG